MSTPTGTGSTNGDVDPTLLGNAPMGEVTVAGDALQIVFRRHLRAPIEKVWAALTTPERLADWFANAEGATASETLRYKGPCRPIKSGKRLLNKKSAEGVMLSGKKTDGVPIEHLLKWRGAPMTHIQT